MTARLGNVQDDRGGEFPEIGKPIVCDGLVVVPTPWSPGVGDAIGGRVRRETLQANRGAQQGAHSCSRPCPVVATTREARPLP